MADVDVYGFDLPSDQNAYYYRDNRMEPTQFIVPTMNPDSTALNKVTYEAGGYVVCGKLVVVNLRFRVKAGETISANTSLYGLPAPLSTYAGAPDGSSLGTTCNNLHQPININDRGYLVTGAGFSCTGAAGTGTMVLVSITYVRK